MVNTNILHKSWYRHFWPWFIIGLLSLTIAGCILTLYLAIRFPDTVVKEPESNLKISQNINQSRTD